MLMVKIPTMVSRTPHRLMLSVEGWAPRVRTTRMMAAVITKSPEERRRKTMSFLDVVLDYK